MEAGIAETPVTNQEFTQRHVCEDFNLDLQNL